MYVCVCNAITENEIKNISRTNADNLSKADDVFNALEYQKRCGRCSEEIESIIRPARKLKIL